MTTHRRKGLFGHGKQALIGDFVEIRRRGQPWVRGVLLRVEAFRDEEHPKGLDSEILPIDILVQEEPLRHQGPTSFYLSRFDRVTFVDRGFLESLNRLATEEGAPTL